MNERIKQLAEQADIVFGFHNNNEVICSAIDIEKFAELIVRECIDIAQDRANFPGYPPNDVNDIIDEIREHFGVEELPVCKHDWYSAKNPVVQNGSICVICGAIDAREPEELKNERTN